MVVLIGDDGAVFGAVFGEVADEGFTVLDLSGVACCSDFAGDDCLDLTVAS